MKRILLSLIPLLAFGCSSIPTPRGTARFWGDYASVEITDGNFRFAAVNMKHSPLSVPTGKAVRLSARISFPARWGLKNPAVGAGATVITQTLSPSDAP